MLTWECGRNLGHLSRLRLLARRLIAQGYCVLAVVRDMPSASALLNSAGIAFMQSPRAIGVPPVSARITGYADLLLSQGWRDRSALWGMLRAWISVYEMFEPDAVVLDYAPTARLAARILNVPSILVGTGFELPPARNPLPAFPGFPWATSEAAAASERCALENVNAVLSAHRARPLASLCSLVEAESRYLTTFAELDHYGAREASEYVGPLADPLDGRRIEWPGHSAKRVFAYLRPEMTEFAAMLKGLAATDADVVAYVPGVSSESLARFETPRCVFSREPVRHAGFLEEADACLSYAPAGTVTAALLKGVPQLMAPVHLESQLTAQRVASEGMGRMLQSPRSPEQVTHALEALLSDRDTRLRARGFAERHRGSTPEAAVARIIVSIETLCRERVPSQTRARNTQPLMAALS